MGMYARQSNVIMTMPICTCLLYTLIPVQKGGKEKSCWRLFFMAYLFQIFNLLMGSMLGHVFWNTPCFLLLVCGTVP